MLLKTKSGETNQLRKIEKMGGRGRGIHNVPQYIAALQTLKCVT